MSTIICMIVDESGSMYGNETEVFDGYNSFIREQLNVGGDARLHLVQFHSDVKIVHRDLPLANVPQLNANSYDPQGNTALFDAIADGINSVASSKKADEKAIIVIITDGEESWSKRNTEQQVKDLIEKYKAEGNWAFIYIGECGKEFAAKMGIPPKNALNFCNEKGKIRANFEAASTACTVLRSNKIKASDVFLNNDV